MKKAMSPISTASSLRRKLLAIARSVAVIAVETVAGEVADPAVAAGGIVVVMADAVAAADTAAVAADDASLSNRKI